MERIRERLVGARVVDVKFNYWGEVKEIVLEKNGKRIRIKGPYHCPEDALFDEDGAFRCGRLPLAVVFD